MLCFLVVFCFAWRAKEWDMNANLIENGCLQNENVYGPAVGGLCV